jgi:hypothetical protein
MKKISPYLKAVYGAGAAALAATGAAYMQGHGHIGWQAGIAIGGAFWGALGVIWAVPNATSSGS